MYECDAAQVRARVTGEYGQICDSSPPVWRFSWFSCVALLTEFSDQEASLGGEAREDLIARLSALGDPSDKRQDSIHITSVDSEHLGDSRRAQTFR
jgi:hypothetical protein